MKNAPCGYLKSGSCDRWKKQYVNNAIKIYCKSVFDALNENDSALIRFTNLSYRFMRVLVFFDFRWLRQNNDGNTLNFENFYLKMDF